MTQITLLLVLIGYTPSQPPSPSACDVPRHTTRRLLRGDARRRADDPHGLRRMPSSSRRTGHPIAPAHLPLPPSARRHRSSQQSGPVQGPLAHSHRPVSDRRQEPTLVRTPRSKLSNARQGGQAPARRDLNGWSHRMSREERMKTYTLGPVVLPVVRSYPVGSRDRSLFVSSV